MDARVVAALAPAFRGEVVTARSRLEVVAPDDDLAWSLWAWAAADFDTCRRRAFTAAPEVEHDRAVLRDAVRVFARVEIDGRVVVPVDEVEVAGGSPVAGLVGFLVTESAYSAGLLERAEAASRHVIERTGPADPFLPWVRLTRIRVLLFLGLVDEAGTELARVRGDIGDWPLGPGLIASHTALVGGVLGDASAVEEAARRTHEEIGTPTEGLGAMALSMAGLALSAVAQPELAYEAVVAAGDLRLLPPISRVHAGDLAIDCCLRMGRIEEARARLARSEAIDLEPGSFGAAAVERSRARLRAVDDASAPDAGPHAEMYLTRDRALADVAALPSAPADLEDLTRVIAGSGLAAVRSWAGREPGNEESSLRLFAGLGWDSLPAQVRVVARLAATGLRNKEIAAMLHLSDRTIESHVAVVLAVLGADSRVGIGDRVPSRSARGPAPSLTGRQTQVAELVTAGLANQQIAERLGIAEKTVEKHLAGAFRRLGVSSRSALAAAMRSR